MSVIDDVLHANAAYASEHSPHAFSPVPRKHLAVLTCMDTRLSLRARGLQDGDARVIRNGGAIVREDALRSLLISHCLLGTREFLIIAHADCGLTQATDAERMKTMEDK